MELLWMVSAVDGECGDGEGKEAENCHGRCGGKVLELLWMVSAGMEKGRRPAAVAVEVR